jgi:membrane protease subunit (stomatin/prohibitin family)
VATTSAVTKAQVDGFIAAYKWLSDVASTLQLEANELNAQASRGGTLYSSPGDVAALHKRDGLLRAVRELRKAAAHNHKQAGEFSRGPCPACARAQNKHCSGCGACSDMNIIRGAKGHLTIECPVLIEAGFPARV